MTTTISTEVADGVLTVTLDRPAQRNALNLAMQRELADLWPTTVGNADVRCVLVTGAGTAFCAGADVGDLAEMSGPRAMGRVEFCPAATVAVPVIVAVNGPCVGAGLRFVADADIVLAAASAWFSDPHVTLGQLGVPVALALADKASSTAVTQLFLSGAAYHLDAANALTAGLVSEVVPGEQLGHRAAQVARDIAAQSPSAVRATVAALRRKHHDALDRHLEAAWQDVFDQRSHPDAAEGARAIIDRRAPVWPPTGDDE